MNHKKKGQVTIFIVLGIVIAILLFGIIMARSGAIRKQTLTDIVSGVGFSKEVGRVQSFLEGCLNKVIADGITTYSVMGFDNDQLYLLKLKEFIENSFPLCTNNFQQFPDLEISKEEVKDVNVSYGPDKKALFVDMDYKLLIEKGENKEYINGLSEEVALTQSCCIPITVDLNCKAGEDKIVSDGCGNTFSFTQGFYVTHNGQSPVAGGICIAC